MGPEKKKLVVTSARFGVADLLSGPVTVTESGNPPLEIVLSSASDTGRIAGTVSGSTRLGTIRRRTEAGITSPIYAPPMFTIKEDGTFAIEDLAPGQYDIGLIGRTGSYVRDDVKSGETTVVPLELK
jgi:hypothetical protein